MSEERKRVDDRRLLNQNFGNRGKVAHNLLLRILFLEKVYERIQIKVQERIQP